MSDRLPMPAAMPVELAERLSDSLPEITEAQIDEAIKCIIEDYLLLGYSYPHRGGRGCVTAGMVLMDMMEDEDIEFALTKAVFQRLAEWGDEQQRLAELLRSHAPEYLRREKYELIERMIDELAEDDE